MFEKLKLNSQIKKYKKQIVAIERRRARSQAALVEAILSNTVPDDDDVDYFNTFTSQINSIREQMHECQRKLDALNLKK
ncbi:MAG: hypothetical protein ACI3XL_01575 [Eubacteriales bacterium]